MTTDEKRRFDELEDRMRRIYPLVYQHQGWISEYRPTPILNRWDLILIAGGILLLTVGLVCEQWT
jgi:hypothetical protein